MYEMVRDIALTVQLQLQLQNVDALKKLSEGLEGVMKSTIFEKAMENIDQRSDTDVLAL